MTRRITHKGIKFGATVAFFLGLGILHHFSVPCIFQTLFSIPCPGCGMTRAYLSLLHLDFAAAFSFHPMFWSVPILYLYVLYDGKLFLNKRLNMGVLIAIGVGFLLSYIRTLVLYF